MATMDMRASTAGSVTSGRGAAGAGGFPRAALRVPRAKFWAGLEACAELTPGDLLAGEVLMLNFWKSSLLIAVGSLRV